MPTDLVAVVTRSKPKEYRHKAVVLEADEMLLFRKRKGGYVILMAFPMCRHRHRTLEKAMLCPDAQKYLADALEQVPKEPISAGQRHEKGHKRA